MNVRDLSGGTAKLLLHLLERGGSWGSMAEMMAGAGISKPTYLEAKRDLQGKYSDLVVKFLGLGGQGSLPGGSEMLTRAVKEVDLGEVKESDHGKGTLPEGAKNIYLGSAGLPPYSVDEHARLWVGTSEPTSLPLGDWPPQVPMPERNFSPVLEKTARDSCIEADALPGDGEYQSPYSNYSKRRAAQVKALCMAHHELFAKELTAYQAKQLLKASRDNAEDAYDALELAKSRNIEYPAAYAVKALERQPKPEVDHSGELDEWTPEWEAKVRASEDKLRAAGAPAYWFGEDDD